MSVVRSAIVLAEPGSFQLSRPPTRITRVKPDNGQPSVYYCTNANIPAREAACQFYCRLDCPMAATYPFVDGGAAILSIVCRTQAL